MERKYGPEGLRLDTAFDVDAKIGMAIGGAGLIVMAVGVVFHAGFAWWIAGTCIIGIGFASLMLAVVREIQSIGARREYQRSSAAFLYPGRYCYRHSATQIHSRASRRRHRCNHPRWYRR